MSGDSEAAPTYYFSGITFNPDFYTTTSSTYLTKTTGKKYFLSYPTAQGDETIDWLYTSQVSTSTPTDAFNFLDSLTGNLYIGENATGTTGQIIQIGAKALTTVKLGALSIKESTIETLAPSTAFNFLASQTANLNIGIPRDIFLHYYFRDLYLYIYLGQSRVSTFIYQIKPYI